MSHTIYAAKFEQTIIHQHVHLRRESQSHAAAHVLTKLYPINKSLICLQSEKEGRHVRIANQILFNCYRIKFVYFGQLAQMYDFKEKIL